MQKKYAIAVQTPTESGFTLIELLITVAIIGTLAAIAIPSYQQSTIRGKRVVAQAGVIDLASRQQQFFLNNKTYANLMSDLGYTAALVFSSGGDSAVALNDNQILVASTSTERVYIIKIDSASSTAFSISAVPQLEQANDVECGTLTLTNIGAKTESGTGSPRDCW